MSKLDRQSNNKSKMNRSVDFGLMHEPRPFSPTASSKLSTGTVSSIPQTRAQSSLVSASLYEQKIHEHVSSKWRNDKMKEYKELLKQREQDQRIM
jgi:hypothetical protein